MKKHDFKQPLNFSPKDRKAENSPSSKLDKNKLASQNIIVVKKFKIESLSKTKEDDIQNLSNMRKSLNNPFSSNLTTNNLLLSIKNKKLNQTSNSHNNEEVKIILPVIEKTGFKTSNATSHYTINKELSTKILKPIINQGTNQSPQKLEDTLRLNPKLNSNNKFISSKICLYARDNQTSLNKKQSRITNNNNDFNNYTVSPQKIKESEKLSEEIKVVNKVRKLVSEKKIKIEVTPKIHTYVIFSDNNGALVKNCMSHRSNWKEAPSVTFTNYNLKWLEVSNGIEFNALNKSVNNKQIVNHFEHHSHISNKLYLFLNMMKYCEEKSLDVFQYMPLTIIIQYDSFGYHTQMQAFSQFFNNIKEYVNQSEMLDPLKFKKYYPFFNLNCKNYIKNDQYLQQMDKIGIKTSLYLSKNYYDGKNLWLVKAIDLNRGRCIKIGDSISIIQKLIQKFYGGINREFKDCENDTDLKSIIEHREEEEEKIDKKMINNIPGRIKIDTKDRKEDKKDEKKEEKKEIKKEDKNIKKYRSSVILLQKYLEKPLLYWGRKFDIRMWVLLTHKLEVYVFREGHLKTCSVEYDINEVDSFVHLTNYSVQKYSENFSKFEVGNEVSFDDFQNYLNINYPEKKFNVRKDLLEMMNEIIKISMKSVADKINENQRKFCFEIFGYDFILDSNFHLYLLEINTNPGLEESSPLINKLVPRMIDDTFRITIDELHNTRYSWEKDQDIKLPCKDRKYCSPFKVDGLSDSENLYQLVCCLNESEKRVERKR